MQWDGWLEIWQSIWSKREVQRRQIHTGIRAPLHGDLSWSVSFLVWGSGVLVWYLRKDFYGGRAFVVGSVQVVWDQRLIHLEADSSADIISNSILTFLRSSHIRSHQWSIRLWFTYLPQIHVILITNCLSCCNRIWTQSPLLIIPWTSHPRYNEPRMLLQLDPANNYLETTNLELARRQSICWKPMPRSLQCGTEENTYDASLLLPRDANRVLYPFKIITQHCRITSNRSIQS